MTAPLKTIEGSGEIAATMSDIGRRAKAAARVLALAATAQKDRALAGMASAIRASKSEMLAANAEDLADGKTAGLTAAMIERLTLNDQRVGKSLVARGQSEARVPVFAHLEGVCHVYVDKAAALDMAKTIVMNAKLRRTGVCGAAETLLVDRAGAETHLQPLIAMLLDAG